MLLAYGKKHISLLRSLVAERGAVVPLHTILEVFRCGVGGRLVAPVVGWARGAVVVEVCFGGRGRLEDRCCCCWRLVPLLHPPGPHPLPRAVPLLSP